MSGALKAADVKAIEAWTQVSGLQAAQVNGDIAVKQTGGVSQSQSSGLVGFLVPLVAETSGPNKEEIRMDTNHFLKVANGLVK